MRFSRFCRAVLCGAVLMPAPLMAGKYLQYFVEEDGRIVFDNQAFAAAYKGKDGLIDVDELAKDKEAAEKAKAAGGEIGSFKEPSRSPEVTWLERHVQIRGSYLNEKGSKDPAKFGLTKAENVPLYYNVDAAVTYISENITPGWELGGSPMSTTIEPFFEAHVSNNPKQSQNSLTYGVPTVFRLTSAKSENIADAFSDKQTQPTKAFVSDQAIYVMPLYQTNQEQETRAMLVSAVYTPTIPRLYEGVALQLFNDNLQFNWRPYGGFEFGSYFPDAEGDSDGIARTYFKVGAELTLFERFALTAFYINRINMTGEGQSTYNYFELSAILLLDRVLASKAGQINHFSVGVTWKRGEDAPDFQDINVLNGWLGVQF